MLLLKHWSVHVLFIGFHNRIAVEFKSNLTNKPRTIENTRCASDCVVECRICNREVAGSNLGLGYFEPRSTQPSTPLGSVNEYQL